MYVKTEILQKILIIMIRFKIRLYKLLSYHEPPGGPLILVRAEPVGVVLHELPGGGLSNSSKLNFLNFFHALSSHVV